MGKVYERPEVVFRGIRIDTYENWKQANPVLKMGEIVAVTDIPTDVLTYLVEHCTTKCEYDDNILAIAYGDGESKFSDLVMKFLVIPIAHT